MRYQPFAVSQSSSASGKSCRSAPASNPASPCSTISACRSASARSSRRPRRRPRAGNQLRPWPCHRADMRAADLPPVRRPSSGRAARRSCSTRDRSSSVRSLLEVVIRLARCRPSPTKKLSAFLRATSTAPAQACDKTPPLHQSAPSVRSTCSSHAYARREHVDEQCVRRSRARRPPRRPCARPAAVMEAFATPAAEGAGFEPARACTLPVFKTGALNRSATPPTEMLHSCCTLARHTAGSVLRSPPSVPRP